MPYVDIDINYSPFWTEEGSPLFVKRVKSAALAAIEELGQEGLRIARKEAPMGDEENAAYYHTPGRLRESIMLEINEPYEAIWGSDAPHAWALEKGKAGHLIFAHDPARGLSFVATGGFDTRSSHKKTANEPGQMQDTNVRQRSYAGKKISPTYVDHPGQSGWHYLEKSFDAVWPQIVDTIRSHMP
jgi:hypothetical protein